MALPIAPTPILRDKEAREFEKMIERDLKNPTTLVPTPKLDEARTLAKKYAFRKTKSS